MSKKDWIDLPRFSDDYIKGVEYFLDFAFTKGNPIGNEILCPCALCCNGKWQKREVVFDHLICKGLVKGYRDWIFHGEDIIPRNLDGDIGGDDVSCDDIDCLLFETFKDVAQANNMCEGLNEDAKKFFKLVEEGNQELYPGCKKFSTLSFTIRIYLLKCLYGWSNASFTALLELLKEAIPDLNIPISFSKTKSIIRDLGLDYKKIDACPNNCMLFWKEHKDAELCYLCGASRWLEYSKVDCELEETKKAHKVPAKVLRHFPLIPRLKRLFMCSRTADSLRWHADGCSRDGKLRHPANGQAWKDFDAKHPEFALDSRNIRLGLASDGFNPFRTMSTSYSIWPVLKCRLSKMKSFNHSIQVKSSTELLRRFQEIKREKIDNLHEKLRGSSQRSIQKQNVTSQPQDMTRKKSSLQKQELKKPSTSSQPQGVAQKKSFLQKKDLEKPCGISQPKGFKERNLEKNDISKSQGKVQKKSSFQKEDLRRPSSIPSSQLQGSTQKAIQEKNDISQLQGFNKRAIQECNEPQQNLTKKTKRNPICPAMLVDDFVETYESLGADQHDDLQLMEEDNLRQLAHEFDGENNVEQVQEDINEEGESTNDIVKGISKKQTRGKTMCTRIHGRTMEEREEVILNDDGQPIGPTERIVSDLSFFLGTLARNSKLCSLIYTNWKAMPKDPFKDNMWAYVNQKFIVPKQGKAWVETTIRDAWRRYKYVIKKDHFLKYANMTERLKNRPLDLPEDHFRKLCQFWSTECIKSISAKNAENRAKQRWRHCMGPKNFAIIRQRMRAKYDRDPTQAEIFIETRQSCKGKQLDIETENAISQLQDLIENNNDNNTEAFEAVFGKGKHGLVRCYGRSVTPTTLKRKEEINAIKREHAEEVASLKGEVANVRDQVHGLQNVVKTLLQSCNPVGVNVESLEALLGISSCDANSVQKLVGQPHAHSSTSTHVPRCG